MSARPPGTPTIASTSLSPSILFTLYFEYSWCIFWRMRELPYYRAINSYYDFHYYYILITIRRALCTRSQPRLFYFTERHEYWQYFWWAYLRLFHMILLYTDFTRPLLTSLKYISFHNTTIMLSVWADDISRRMMNNCRMPQQILVISFSLPDECRLRADGRPYRPSIDGVTDITNECPISVTPPNANISRMGYLLAL